MILFCCCCSLISCFILKLQPHISRVTVQFLPLCVSPFFQCFFFNFFFFCSFPSPVLSPALLLPQTTRFQKQFRKLQSWTGSLNRLSNRTMEEDSVCISTCSTSALTQRPLWLGEWVRDGLWRLNAGLQQMFTTRP